MTGRSRCHQVKITAHEKLLLVFYRAIPLDQQLDIDGLMGVWWKLPGVDERWRLEGRAVGIGSLSASHIAAFMDATRRVAGVCRRPL